MIKCRHEKNIGGKAGGRSTGWGEEEGGRLMKVDFGQC